MGTAMNNFLKIAGGFSLSYLAIVSALVLSVEAAPNWASVILGVAIWLTMVIGHYSLRRTL